MDASNVTVDTLLNTSNTQRENTNAIFTGEKLDKSDNLLEAVNNLTINDAEYHESNTATASDAQGDLTHNPKTVTHTSNGKETFSDTSNGDCEQKILSNRTLPIVVPTMNPRIDNKISPIGGASQTLLTLKTKEVAADTVLFGAWFNQTPRQVSPSEADGITPGKIGHSVRSKPAPSPVLIVSVTASPICGLSRSLHAANKRQSTSPAVVRNVQN